MEEKPSVLIIEDRISFFKPISDALQRKTNVLWARTIEEGERLFEENLGVDIIIMDACVPGDIPNTMPLIEKIVAKGYKKPIIACSSSDIFRKKLIAAGATHEASKGSAAAQALELLGLN